MKLKHTEDFFIYAFFVVMIIAAVMLSGCRSANSHLRMAIKKGAEVSTDTLYKTLSVKFPEIKPIYDFKPIPTQGDTVDYSDAQTGVITKIIYQRDAAGQPIAAKPTVKCPERTRIIKVPYQANTKIKAGMSTWDIIILCAAMLVIGAGIGYWYRARNIITIQQRPS